MAARKFGGRYSPDGSDGPRASAEAPHVQDRPPKPVSSAARLLYLAAIPMLIAGVFEIFASDPLGIAAEIGAFLLFAMAAWLINDGLRAEAAYNARAVAKPPAVPRKILGAVAAGLGVGIGAIFGAGMELVPGLGLGAIAIAAGLLGFGLDPLTSKGLTGQDGRDGRRVAEAVERAEGMVAEMVQAVRGLNDRALEGRVERFGAAAHEMFRAVEEDPRDLSRARKFLGVYLTGARDATVKFAEVYAKTRDEAARTEYEALLKDLERSFETHRAGLLDDNRSALDVEIEVLRKRLKQEGLA
ncbi:MAG: 5-bromo-4-chloroindolyl phosphate hydrolysis family protein [Pseudomonadota bacterium]